MSLTLQDLIKQLELSPHPEGGYYKETYRSEGSIPQEALGAEYSSERSHSTGIYFLLTADNFSAFHRIHQDEMWHFYYGEPIRVHMIAPTGEYSYQDLGMDFSNGQVPQFVVPGGYWFASEVSNNKGFGLVGCTVSPGFDFEDFELATRESLLDEFIEHEEVIRRLTRL